MKGKGIYIPISSVKYEETYTGQTQDTASTESWLGQMKRRSDRLLQNFQVSKNVCIYRVPKPMRIFKPEDFDPFVVSFGPFHRKMNRKPSTTDDHKLEAVHITSERLGIDVTDLIIHIQALETQIRECYEEPIDWDTGTLSWALAMDACFILEFLKGPIRIESQNDTDHFSLVFQNLRQMNSMYFSIINDIMKLENQIPLFILKSILKIELKTDEKVEKRLCLMLCASGLFEGFPFRSTFAGSYSLHESLEELRKHVQKKPAHLLDLYRMVITDLLTISHDERDMINGARNTNSHHVCCEWSINIPATGSTRSSYDRSESVSFSELLHFSDDSRSTPTAEFLQTAGIKLEPGQIGFRNRRFGKSTFSLPQIRVDDKTVILLRNAIAYEECQRCSWDPKETVISHFLVLLDYLIGSAKDVSVLRKAGVISSMFCSDEDIACKFKNICQGTTVGTYDEFEKLVDRVMKKAREHYDSQVNVWIREFKEEHCSKPWYIVSLAAGILLLAMTAVQTVYAVKK